MILDLSRFLAEEQAVWHELEGLLTELERGALGHELGTLQRLHYLYQRTAGDLARLHTFTAEEETRAYLEALVARGYGQLHMRRVGPRRKWRIGHWFFTRFPRTVKVHAVALGIALAATLGGALFGSLALALDRDAKAVLMPFEGLRGSPSDRVKEQERDRSSRLEGHHATFASQLMTHNIRVSVKSLALGLTYGLGTLVMLFYNGVILGAVVFDYLRDGQTAFLIGWLLPHGSVEIPAFVLAGQAGLVLAGALIGWGRRQGLRERLRLIAPDLATLIGGVAIMLVWAGLIESFFSQYHEPVLPYGVKIAFGAVQLACVVVFFAWRGGREVADGRSV